MRMTCGNEAKRSGGVDDSGKVCGGSHNIGAGTLTSRSVTCPTMEGDVSY